MKRLMQSALKYYKSLFFAFILTLVLFVGYSSRPARAADDFTHTIRTDYYIREDNSTFAEYTFTTTNKVGNNYMKSFSLNLPFQPKNLNSLGTKTPINLGQLKQISNRNFYSLDIEFPTPVYGLNRSFEWKITFEVEKFVIDHGVQNAIIIPAFNNQTSISGFEINTHIPSVLGEVRSIYGNGVVSKTEKESVVVFKAEESSATSYMILLGDDQEYYFETLKVTDGAKIYLPKTLPYQETSYTQFPARTFNSGDLIDSSIFSINADEALKAFIKTTIGHEKEYVDEKDEIVDLEMIKNLTSDIQTKDKSKVEIARKAYDVVSTSFELNDYITNIDTKIELSTDKRKVNPAELNKVYRQVLSSFGIENRGVFGYVFPIQPFQRNEYVTEQHVWTEFWDGEKWIVADPTWRISSRGTNYFDRNAFHHVKFGTYHELSDLETFFANSGLVKLTPVKYKSMVERKLDISMSAYNDTYLNKEFRVVIKNTSNDIIKLNSMYPSIDMKGISLRQEKIDLNKPLYPGSEVTVTIPLEYGIIVKNKEGGVHVSIEYEDQNKAWSSKAFTHTITVRSNISRYLSQVILVIVIIFVFISIGSFTIYRKKI